MQILILNWKQHRWIKTIAGIPSFLGNQVLGSFTRLPGSDHKQLYDQMCYVSLCVCLFLEYKKNSFLNKQNNGGKDFEFDNIYSLFAQF